MTAKRPPLTAVKTSKLPRDEAVKPPLDREAPKVEPEPKVQAQGEGYPWEGVGADIQPVSQVQLPADYKAKMKWLMQNTLPKELGIPRASEVGFVRKVVMDEIDRLMVVKGIETTEQQKKRREQ